jgi:hypothetical protein
VDTAFTEQTSSFDVVSVVLAVLTVDEIFASLQTSWRVKE